MESLHTENNLAQPTQAAGGEACKTMVFYSRVLVHPTKKRKLWCNIVKIAMIVLVLTALIQTLAGDADATSWAQAVLALAIGGVFLKRPENASHVQPSNVTLDFFADYIAIAYAHKNSCSKPFQMKIDNISEVVYSREVSCMQFKFVSKIKESSNKTAHFLWVSPECEDELIARVEALTGKSVIYETV